MNWLDIALVIGFVAVCAWAAYQRLLRQLMTLGVLYLATLVAGSFYRMVTGFFKAIARCMPSVSEVTTRSRSEMKPANSRRELSVPVS